MEKLSIVIPVFNDVRIARALDSVRSQDYNGRLEVLVIDGASTDDTLDVVRRNPDVVDVLISEPDDGIFHALNKGIQQASGDVIALLGADDRFDNPHVFSAVREALRDPSCDGCYGDLLYVDDDDNVVRYWRSGPYKPIKVYLGWIVPHFTLFLRRSVYQEFGLLDTRYRVAADYDFFLRLLLKRKARLRYIDSVLVRMTLGGNSNRSLAKVLEGNLDAARAWRNNDLRCGWVAPILKPLGKLPQLIMRPRRELVSPPEQSCGP